MQYRRERAFSHYGWREKSTRGICTKALWPVKQKILECSGRIPAHMELNEMYGQDGEANVPTLSQSTPTNGGIANVTSVGPSSPIRGTSSTKPSRVASCTMRSRSMWQQELDEVYQLNKQKELDEKWASFFYDANVPFNVGRHLTFVEAVNATTSAGFNYKPPLYNAFRTTLIESKKMEVEVEVKKATSFSIETYGVSLCSDGWDNVVHCPLMNIMLSCPADDIFLGLVDTSGNKKTKEYIAGELKKFIEHIGPMKVSQICIDNAANMLRAVDKVIETYPHIYKQGCAAHALDLLLEDWAKIPQFKDLIAKAKRVCLFVRNHHITLALFKEFSHNKMLLMPTNTWFACNFIMIMRMVEVREALENVVMHHKFVEYVATLFNRQNGVQAHALATQVRSRVLDENFWRQCQNYMYMVEDVMMALWVFDGKEPAMEKAWLRMNNLRKHIFRLWYPSFSLTPAIAEEIEENFMQRWDMMLTDLYYVGAMLNPYLRGHMELQQNGDIMLALNRVFCRLSNLLGVGFNEVMAEMTKYEERLGLYSPEEALDIQVANLQPHQWWLRIGGEALPKIAKWVLALKCSASSYERNWSMYSFVHNKSRNCLGTKKAEDLVYIYTNTRFLRGRLEADPLRWYENNMFSEDEDESVDDDSDMDDGDDDDNESGGKGMEGNEPINDDERRDDEGRENIEDEDNVGIFY